MEDLNEARRGGNILGKRNSVIGGRDCLACWEETMKRKGVWEKGQEVGLSMPELEKRLSS